VGIRSKSANADALGTILDKLKSDALPVVKKMKAKARQNTLSGVDAWYQASYDVFTGGPRKTLADYIIVIGHAYSWLPRNNPVACPTKAEFREFREAIETMRKHGARPGAGRKRNDHRKILIEKTRAALKINSPNSIVTVSKVLHFWNPSLAPMIDANVVDALRVIAVSQSQSPSLEGYLSTPV
jgi:hypothetical protein